MAAIARVCLDRNVSVRQAGGALFVLWRNSSSDVATIKKKVTLQNCKRGRGGRSSFSGIVATVFGATGMIGRSVVNELGKIGSQVIIPYRGEEYDVDHLKVLGDVGQILFQPFHLCDDESLRKSMQYSNVVINCISKQTETKNFSFEDVHIAGPRRIARIAKECGVEKFIHFSHINANYNAKQHKVFLKGGSRFLQTKLEGEEAVREEFPEAIIIRPSDVISDKNQFLRHYQSKFRQTFRANTVQLWKRGLETVKKPVLNKDVMKCVMTSLFDPVATGKTIDCYGSESWLLKDLVELIFYSANKPYCVILNMNPYLSQTVFKAKVSEWKYSPWEPFITVDRLERDTISDERSKGNLMLEDLGISPSPVKDTIAFLIRRTSKVDSAKPDMGPQYRYKRILKVALVMLMGAAGHTYYVRFSDEELDHLNFHFDR